MLKLLKTLIGILLIPVAVGAAKAFYVAISGIDVLSNSLHVLERGVLAYLLLHVLIMRPVYIYVLGHEFVHVLATWICGGKIVSFSVTPSGGNVVTSKTNFFIELSPYFVPIYTLLLGPIFMLLRTLNVNIAHMSSVFLFLVGATLAFHFVMTSEVLRIKQSDIAKSGFIFSLVLIFIGNLIIIIAVFTPFFDSISFAGFIKSAAANSIDLYRQLVNKIMAVAKIAGVWHI
ncbi:MAG: hypothetical protein PVH45_05215 [Candidatus Omnitrophota bacterium]|jgi:hypothetical protein